MEHLYGINPAFEALRAGRRTIRAAYFGPGGEGGSRRRKLTELLAAAGVPVQPADKRRLFQLCGATEHQGVVLEVSPYPYAALEELQAASRLLLVDNVEDPQNVGAILRSAEVFGWRDVLLANRGVPEVYPSVVKASSGAAEHLRIARDHTATEYVRRLLPLGFTLAALDGRGTDALDDLAARPPEKLLLVIGGEHRAVGQHLLNQARYRVAIRQQGRITSLNASVAAGIALYALQAPRRVAPLSPGE